MGKRDPTLHGKLGIMSDHQAKRQHRKPAGEPDLRRVLGICLGASTVTTVLLEVGSADPDASRSRVGTGAVRIAKQTVHPHGGDPRKTLRAGIAAYDETMTTIEELLRAADQQLYRAKKRQEA